MSTFSSTVHHKIISKLNQALFMKPTVALSVVCGHGHFFDKLPFGSGHSGQIWEESVAKSMSHCSLKSDLVLI